MESAFQVISAEGNVLLRSVSTWLTASRMLPTGPAVGLTGLGRTPTLSASQRATSAGAMDWSGPAAEAGQGRPRRTQVLMLGLWEDMEVYMATPESAAHPWNLDPLMQASLTRDEVGDRPYPDLHWTSVSIL